VEKVIPSECLVNGGISFNGTHNCKILNSHCSLMDIPDDSNFSQPARTGNGFGSQPVLADSTCYVKSAVYCAG